MKPHFQCAEQQLSPSNLPKYYACHAERLTCFILITYETSFTMRGATVVARQPHQVLRHEKWHCKISKKAFENRWNVISNAGPIRPWSENNPRIKPTVRNPPRNRGYFSSSPRAFSIVKYNVWRPILHSNLHQVLHLPRKVTLALHQVLRPATKSDTGPSPSTAPATKSDTWPSPSTAPATKSDTRTSPSIAPATKKWHLTFTKYCTCHEKWH